MATGIPPASEFSGLTRKVMDYAERFEAIVGRAKQGLTEADWAGIEKLVDIDKFERVGRFLTEQTETIDWPTYKGYIAKYGGYTEWDATLRRITEGDKVVIQELEERNTAQGMSDVANTVMIYRFNEAGLIDHLDVYVAHLEKRPAQ
jgi:hypothetical protein